MPIPPYLTRGGGVDFRSGLRSSGIFVTDPVNRG
jgi:hypothetical protein